MHRYYFHMRRFDGEVLEDIEGIELPNLHAARARALRDMQALLGEAIRFGQEPEYEAIIIADDGEKEITAVPVAAALTSRFMVLLKRPEKFVPPHRFEQFRLKAEACRDKADGSDDPEDKLAWLQLAQAWLMMLPPAHIETDDLLGWPKANDNDSKASH